MVVTLLGLPVDTSRGDDAYREIGLTVEETQGLSTLLMVAGTETAASAMARTAALLADSGEQHRLRAGERVMVLTARCGRNGHFARRA